MMNLPLITPAIRTLKRLGRNEARRPSIPSNKRVYAVGDIHGRLDLLDAMLAKIAADSRSFPGECMIIFLGDYINRGPASAQVLDRLCAISARSPRTRFLMGNHEEIFLRALNQESGMLKMLIRMGGRQTVLSYGVSADRYRSAGYDELENLLQDHVPKDHLEFLGGLESQVILGDYIFVHAGVDFSKAVHEQDPRVTRWIRGPFAHSNQQCAMTVVYGHTVYREVDRRGCGIGIDTGAYASGKLTAIALEGSRQWLLQTDGDCTAGVS